MSRLARIFTWAAAASAAAGAAIAALQHDWTTTVWAALTAAWALAHALHTCPTPRPARGDQYVTFQGGPLDGASIPFGTRHDANGAHINYDGTGYTAAIDHTCYTATPETHP